MCRNLEKSFQANQESYKVDSERFVDLKNMLQRRYDDIMKFVLIFFRKRIKY